ncbi:MAG: glycosyltransferase family 1 protein [Candidatus Omnitrophota bacterium]
MKILILGNYILDQQKSMQLFSALLEKELRKSGHDVRLIRPEPFFGKIGFFGKALSKWLGYLDKFFIFPFVLRRNLLWAEVVHICDHSNAFYTGYLKSKPHLVTCHDLLAIRSALGEFPENRTHFAGKIFQKLILSGLNNAKRVACVSETTKSDLLRISKLEPEKVSVIADALNYPYSVIEKEKVKEYLLRLKLNPDSQFILHVGGNQWYKNRAGVLEIFKALISFPEFSDTHLIFSGAAWTKQMRLLIKKYNLKEKVHEIIYPDSNTLCALYSGAKALVYPSLYEGFGWPIIEAQACGCPVFTTNRPPMTETGSDAAVYIEPRNPQECASVIRNSLNDENKISAMEKKGFINAQKFSTDKMLNAYLAVYKEVINAHTSSY